MKRRSLSCNVPSTSRGSCVDSAWMVCRAQDRYQYLSHLEYSVKVNHIDSNIFRQPSVPHFLEIHVDFVASSSFYDFKHSISTCSEPVSTITQHLFETPSLSGQRDFFENIGLLHHRDPKTQICVSDKGRGIDWRIFLDDPGEVLFNEVIFRHSPEYQKTLVASLTRTF